MPSEREIIDVDAYEPDIEITGTRASQAPRVLIRYVQNNARTQQQPLESIDLERGDHADHRFASRPVPTPIEADYHLASSSRGKLKRKKSKSSVRRVHPDDDNDHKVRKQPIARKPKLSDTSDEEDNYANIYSALDDSLSNWQPFRNTNSAAEPTPSAPAPPPPPPSQRTPISCPDAPLHRKIARRLEHTTRASYSNQGQLVWNALRRSFPVPTDYRRSSADLRPTREKLQKDLQLHNLRLSKRFRQAAGSIHKVAQSSGVVAFCGACLGGQLEEPNEELDLYNGPGSLIVWYAGQEQIIHDHSTIRRRRTRPSFHKYYTVNDVKFHSILGSTVMASSGYDCRVRIWSCSPDASATSLSLRLEKTISYTHVPFELAFKPGESILSVACRDGKVYVYSQLHPFETRAQTVLLVVPDEAQHSAGAMTWGLGVTSNQLFVSSEPYNDEDPGGYHRAFDMAMSTVLYDFDAKEAGDAMALDYHGDRLAISTHGENHILRLYDIRRQIDKAVWETNLELFLPMPHCEVNTVKFSPDTIYLAVGRSDDTVHIYDSRMIERGVLHTFEHAGARADLWRNGKYGVVELQWLESRTRRLGLVTGGTDGCIRLWDVCKASDSHSNGIVLAQADSDIGHFSLGDIYKGEKAMVVGDCDGTAYIYDNIDVEL